MSVNGRLKIKNKMAPLITDSSRSTAILYLKRKFCKIILLKLQC